MINTRQYTTPEHLKLLGIEICPDCGKERSFENKICYSCGFKQQSIDLDLHERLLNEKYQPKLNNSKTLFLVKKRAGHNNVYHIFISGVTVCGLKSNAYLRLDVFGEMNKKNYLKFKYNHCNRCYDYLNNKEAISSL